MQKFLAKVLSFGESKKLKVLQDKVDLVTEFEPEISILSDSELQAKTGDFKKRFQEGETLDELLPEVFAVVREAAKRVLKMRHFDVQIMGGIVLFEGKIAEMKTGEGKTLVATLPVYLESIAGHVTHVVTVNDYLAKRDSEWMGRVYNFLGVKVGLIQTMMEPELRVEAYKANVIYGTNSEFGFDYLRDNMAVDPGQIVQSGYDFAIVDEVDSILIDEARTPLIISGEAEKAADIYRSFAKIVPRLKAETDFEVDEKTRTVAVTDSGINKVEKALGINNLYDHANSQLVNHLNQALRAYALFKKDVDYVVNNGEVIIVDEFTGRLMEGRRYSEGLHQAIEAKERVHIREESQTLATITLQNYFRLYNKLSGMTGTAATEANEFRHIYKLETVVIPTNMPLVRLDKPDSIYKSEPAKFNAVIEDIAKRHQVGQPVLVGTISIEKSEVLSKMLKKKGIKHEVLNAKHHEREAEIISQAGRVSAVTVATNMAGRGVDIILGGSPPTPEEAEKVKQHGGLYVLGTERHESRRIDNQLRGRSGRQGDPGESRFYLSLEDDLMRLFGSDRVKGVMERLGVPDDQPIEHALISKSIETAQRQVESQNFEIRKQVLEYDDVMNQQREIVYDRRNHALHGTNLEQDFREMVENFVDALVEKYTAGQPLDEGWDWDGLNFELGTTVLVQVKPENFNQTKPEGLRTGLIDLINQAFKAKADIVGDANIRKLLQWVNLRIIDEKWREHLYEMDQLKEGINLRAVGQKDPLIEYKREGFDLFVAMLDAVDRETLRLFFHAQLVEERAPQRRPRARNVAQQHAESTGMGFLNALPQAPNQSGSVQPAAKAQPVHSGPKVGVNGPCPCGSEKKYKKFHGRFE